MWLEKGLKSKDRRGHKIYKDVGLSAALNTTSRNSLIQRASLLTTCISLYHPFQSVPLLHCLTNRPALPTSLVDIRRVARFCACGLRNKFEKLEGNTGRPVNKIHNEKQEMCQTIRPSVSSHMNLHFNSRSRILESWCIHTRRCTHARTHVRTHTHTHTHRKAEVSGRFHQWHGSLSCPRACPSCLQLETRKH